MYFLIVIQKSCSLENPKILLKRIHGDFFEKKKWVCVIRMLRIDWIILVFLPLSYKLTYFNILCTVVNGP